MADRAVADSGQSASFLRRAAVTPEAVFTGVEVNSPVGSVLELARVLRAHGADGIAVIGGGSAMVTARAAAIVLAEGDDIAALSTRREGESRYVSPRLRQPKIPIVVVPTTPTTAMAKSGAGIVEPGRPGRWSLFDPKTRAQALVIDPDIVDASPHPVWRNAVVTGISMAVEGLTSPAATIFSDASLGRAYDVLTAALGSAGPSTAMKIDTYLAAILVGEGTDVAGGGVVAALSHVIGQEVARPNAELDAVLLPAMLKVGAGLASRRWLTSVGGDPADFLESLFKQVGMPSRLSDIGLERGMLEHFVHEAQGDFSFLGRTDLTSHDLRNVLLQAW